MNADQAASQQMIFVTANFENFSMNDGYKQYFIEEITFQESCRNKTLMFFHFYNENGK